MSRFHDAWRNTGGQIGKALQLVVEYETKENGRNVRAFETQAEYDQWCMEMGENIRVISMRKGGREVELSKSYLVRVNGQDHGSWEEEKEAKAYLQMLREGGTFGVMIEQTLVGAQKSMVKTSHTDRWDRCVEHVKGNSPGADPFAVCTAMLGDESFKAMEEPKFNEMIDKALEQMGKDSFGIGGIGISAAGPIPESKLARQDLEGSTTKKSFGSFTPADTLVSRIRANQKGPMAKGSSFRDAWSRVKAR